MNFDPESPFGQQLNAQVTEKLRSMNLTDDPSYVAEFLLVLISNNRTAEEIMTEFNSLFGNAININFVNEVLDEVKHYQQGAEQGFNGQQQTHQQQQEAQQQQAQQQQQQAQQQQAPQQHQQSSIQQQTTIAPQAQSQPEFLPQQPAAPIKSAFTQSAFQNHGVDQTVNKANGTQQVHFDDSGSTAMEGIVHGSIPTGPHITSAFGKGSTVHRGVSKGGNTKNKKSFALRNQRNFHQLMEKSLENGSQSMQFVPRKPIGRCKKFPHCHDRNCRYAHPAKICFAYPNCPNPPGTCNYLHPGEDDALMAELEKTRQERRAHKFERSNNIVKQVSKQVEQRLLQKTNGITLCKFGAVCQREMCPFGHPTPANKDAKVLTLEWCPANKNCIDPSCTKAHSSPNYKPPEGGDSMQESSQRSLEQCKFGRHCKNPRCLKRHATTNVLCRDGADCKRIDCYFQHPIDEPCKFGANCKNANCPFQHPEDRNLNGGRNMVWVKDQNGNGDGQNTDQRQFAVPDDQVMEQAPPQQV
ncbi:hypothetical protein HII13_001081 [Brettanomyces bruxellensis]|nr:hypothetical protein HII13_001081 [Brettanomyces bruxellensis]